MPELKSATQALHDATEHGTFNKLLVTGKLPRQAFVDLLGQFFVVHQALERHLRAAVAARPTWQTIVRDYQYQEPYLREDLAYFGVDPESVQAMPATTAFMTRIEQYAASNPVGLLGIHYVFEGSNNGSKYIARALRKAYDLNDGGLRYFDPYGENQGAYWKAFKDAMNADAWTEDDTAVLIESARAAFAATGAIHQALGIRYGTEATGSHGCPAMRPS
ncbi:MAG: biliverdin-producing heme oxygenase [Phycisphaerales bacterium]|nr:biliverdin-producing heme oxygenase [Phycisphaerales bacterium]MCB9864836.1 biliverdin-producing heme oxygenase [Phycisphaerales bacterium]